MEAAAGVGGRALPRGAGGVRAAAPRARAPPRGRRPAPRLPPLAVRARAFLARARRTTRPSSRGRRRRRRTSSSRRTGGRSASSPDGVLAGAPPPPAAECAGGAVAVRESCSPPRASGGVAAVVAALRRARARGAPARGGVLARLDALAKQRRRRGSPSDAGGADAAGARRGGPACRRRPEAQPLAARDAAAVGAAVPPERERGVRPLPDGTEGASPPRRCARRRRRHLARGGGRAVGGRRRRQSPISVRPRASRRRTRCAASELQLARAVSSGGGLPLADAAAPTVTPASLPLGGAPLGGRPLGTPSPALSGAEKETVGPRQHLQGGGRLHHVDVRRRDGPQWQFYLFYSDFRRAMSEKLGMGDYRTRRCTRRSSDATAARCRRRASAKIAFGFGAGGFASAPTRWSRRRALVAAAAIHRRRREPALSGLRIKSSS